MCEIDKQKKTIMILNRMGRAFFFITAVFILITVSFYSCKNNKNNVVDLGDIYIITTPEQLDAMRNNLSANYKLGANIDLEEYLDYGGAGYAKWGEAGWEPVATFTGSLDGAGYKITGLWIDRP